VDKSGTRSTSEIRVEFRRQVVRANHHKRRLLTTTGTSVDRIAGEIEIRIHVEGASALGVANNGLRREGD